MCRAKAVIPLVFFTATLHAIATTSKPGAVAQHVEALPAVDTDLHSPIGSTLRGYYTAGPATMSWRDSISVSGVAATFDIDRQSTPVTVQEGNGHNLYRLEARSYYKLSASTTVWGDASFTSGVTRNVTWADCIDYTLLAPYMIGDNTGGNITHQRYTFGGGWTRHYGDWTIGASAAYRAENAHRAHDPRVRDIVSDLTISLGAAHTVGNRYLLALDASLRVYHQDCDVDYYNPANTILTRMLTGLGSVYNRFDNNQVNSTGHNLTGWSAAATFAPVNHGDGISARVSITGNNASLVLRQFNNLTLASTSTRHLDASVSWHINAGHPVSLMPTIKASAITRDGKENLFGTSSGTSYDKIGSRNNYSHDMMSAAITVPVEWNVNRKVRLSATPAAAYATDKESLAEPVRRLEVNRLTAAVDLSSSIRFGSATMLTVAIDGALSSASPKAPVWGNLNLDEPLGQAVKSNYDMHAADITRAGIKARISRSISGKILSLGARYAHTVYRSMGHTDNAAINLSLTF